jgi:hypothetical protein
VRRVHALEDRLEGEDHGPHLAHRQRLRARGQGRRVRVVAGGCLNGPEGHEGVSCQAEDALGQGFRGGGVGRGLCVLCCRGWVSRGEGGGVRKVSVWVGSILRDLGMLCCLFNLEEPPHEHRQVLLLFFLMLLLLLLLHSRGRRHRRLLLWLRLLLGRSHPPGTATATATATAGPLLQHPEGPARSGLRIPALEVEEGDGRTLPAFPPVLALGRGGRGKHDAEPRGAGVEPDERRAQDPPPPKDDPAPGGGPLLTASSGGGRVGGGEGVRQVADVAPRAQPPARVFGGPPQRLALPLLLGGGGGGGSDMERARLAAAALCGVPSKRSHCVYRVVWGEMREMCGHAMPWRTNGSRCSCGYRYRYI